MSVEWEIRDAAWPAWRSSVEQTLLSLYPRARFDLHIAPRHLLDGVYARVTCTQGGRQGVAEVPYAETLLAGPDEYGMGSIMVRAAHQAWLAAAPPESERRPFRIATRGPRRLQARDDR